MAQGRIHLGRASDAGAGRRRQPRCGRRHPAPIQRHEGCVAGSADDRTRTSAGHQRHAGNRLRGARQVRPRTGGASPTGQTRPGHRARRRNPPYHSDSLPKNQEQPGADRRARRRQDGHRRGIGAAHRQGRRAGVATRPACLRPGHGCLAGRRQVPRRVRGASQGRAQRNQGERRPHHSVHRRVAQHRRSRAHRGFAGRRQHAKTHAGARRVTLHRRHDTQRASSIHRERCGPGAALPAGDGGRAVGRGHHLNFARPA